MPLLSAKKEVFAWIKTGKKTIEVRKGRAKKGEVAVIQSGRSHLRFKIIRKETGTLSEVIREDNYLLIIPTAKTLGDAHDYLSRIYKGNDGFFTAYYLEQLLGE